jgi:type IV secretion system protein VirB11
VSGGTGSGKTTLLNSLLREIDNNDRIVTLEDSKELIIKQPNHIRLLKSKTGTDVAKLTYKDFINVIMRLRPDRIL